MPKNDAAPSSPARAVAMVLLPVASAVDGAAVARLMGRRRPTSVEQEGDLLALDVEGEPSLVALMPAPIPWRELAGPCDAAWWWPEAERVCRTLRAHLVVSTQASSGDLFEASLRLTDLVSAVATAASAPAIYWGAGTLVHETSAFVEEARHATRALLPLRLWVDFRIVPLDGDQVFFATTGLSSFGLMELECLGTRASIPQVVDRLFNVAHYLCDKGPVLGDGHSLGLDAVERIRVHHRPSRWAREGRVLFLEVER